LVPKESLVPRRPIVLALLAIVVTLAGLYGAFRSPATTPVQTWRAKDTIPTTTRHGWTGRIDQIERSRPVDIDALAQELIDRGRAALADGDFRAGFEAYRQALEYTPTAETHGLVGDLYLRAAATSEAAFHLRRAADLDPDNADRWLALANVYILKTDLGAAWNAIERAKEVEPGITVERDRNNFVVRGHAG
jgi:tetratricopeptide (TPR) repeat protein